MPIFATPPHLFGVVSPPLASSDQYATDEQLYVEEPADYAVLVPHANRMIEGQDGVISRGSPWVLTSGTCNFANAGIQAGMVIRLYSTAHTVLNNNATIPPQHRQDFLAVAITPIPMIGNSLTLKRCGMAQGVGMPYANGTAIGFEIATFGPQLENASYSLNEQFSVDPALPNRTPGDEYDQRVLRRAAICRVLANSYAAANRTTNGDFKGKADHYAAQYTAELDTASVRWGPRGQTQESTNRFSTRLSR